MGVFLCSYLVDRITGSPLLVQFVGAAIFAPMFFGGAIAGVVADRFDRRLTILRQLLILIPIAMTMGLVVVSGSVQVWMVYPFMLVVGVGGVVDMTSRRALIYDIVGPERATNALALESLSMSGGTTLGAFFGGAVINFVGVGQCFFLIALLYSASFLLLRGVPSPAASRTGGGASILADLREGGRFLRGSRPMVSILGVTVLMNLFYFSFMPMVPVFARQMHVNALFAGILAGATGMGMMIGSFAWAAWPTQRRGLVYVGGCLVAMAFLALFALLQWYPIALVLLICAGVGSSGFGTMQGVLVMAAAGQEMRGRAMGLLSMAIGGLPFGMIALGGVAQGIGAAPAVTASVIMGFATFAIWLWKFPEAGRIR
jgi:MFS family permease